MVGTQVEQWQFARKSLLPATTNANSLVAKVKSAFRSLALAPALA